MGDTVHLSPETILKRIARASGKPVRSFRMLDLNVCASRANREKPWEIDENQPGDLFSKRVVLRNAKPRVTITSNCEYLGVEIEADLPFDVFSVNRRDKMFPVNPVYPEPRIGSLFTRDGSVANSLEQAIASPELRNLVATLNLRRQESIHCYRNGLIAYLKPISVDQVESVIVSMRQFVQAFGSRGSRGSKNQEVRLPKEFRRLAVLALKWGESDDEKRGELLMNSPKRSLRHLVRSVKPHLVAIDEFISSFGDQPLSESAISLGALAECTIEAEQLLRIPE